MSLSMNRSSEERLDGEQGVMHAATKDVNSELDERSDQLLSCSVLEEGLSATAGVLRVVGGRDSAGENVDMKPMKSILMLAKDIPTAGGVEEDQELLDWEMPWYDE